MSDSSPLMPARQRAQELADAGDLEAAVALLEHVISLGRVNLGEDDPDLLSAAHHLARVHLQSEDPAAARRVLEEAYAAGQWRLGDSFPLMLEISYDLGVVAEELGNRHEARKALARVVEVGTPVLGDFHWAVLKARAYLDGNTGALSEPIPRPAAAAPASEPARPPLTRRVPSYEQIDETDEREDLPQAYAEAIADLPTQLHPIVSSDAPRVEARPEPAPHTEPRSPLVQQKPHPPVPEQRMPPQPAASPEEQQPVQRAAQERAMQQAAEQRAAQARAAQQEATERQAARERAAQQQAAAQRAAQEQAAQQAAAQRAAQEQAQQQPSVAPPQQVVRWQEPTRDLGVQRLEPRYDHPGYERLPSARSGLPERQPPVPSPQPVAAPAADSPVVSLNAYPQKRSPAVFAAVAAVLAAIIAVVALVFVLVDRGGEPPAAPQQPVVGGGPPPTDVTLRDFGSSVEVRWADPGPGRVSFVIAGGLPGEVLKPMGEVGPGTTSFRLQGLNEQVDYCFAVFAVYSASEFSPSPQSCTSRPDAQPSD